MAEFTQVPLGSARTGRQVAFLEGTSDSFSRALGIAFERVRDDLDELDAAQIRTKSGVHAVLGFYPDAPKQGVFVYISEISIDPARDLAEVLQAIRGAGARVIWTEAGC